MYDNQNPLRTAAHAALVQEGYSVRQAKGIAGARLSVERDNERLLALVRTSSDRWLGWMRDQEGAWRGLSEGDLVVAAVLTSSKDAAEVYAFRSTDVEQALTDNLAARLKHDNPCT